MRGANVPEGHGAQNERELAPEEKKVELRAKICNADMESRNLENKVFY